MNVRVTVEDIEANAVITREFEADSAREAEVFVETMLGYLFDMEDA